MATGQALPELILAMPVQLTPSLYPWQLAVYNNLVAAISSGAAVTLNAAILALAAPAGALPASIASGRRCMGFAVLPLLGGAGIDLSFCESGVAVPVPHSGGGLLHCSPGVWSLASFSINNPLLKTNVISQGAATTFDLVLFLDRLPTE